MKPGGGLAASIWDVLSAIFASSAARLSAARALKSGNPGISGHSMPLVSQAPSNKAELNKTTPQSFDACDRY
jgi:hypothetical protein